MKNKIIKLLLTTLLLLTGCSTSISNSSTGLVSSTTSNVDLAKMIPENEFETDNLYQYDDSYSIHFLNVSKEQYTDYITKCKDMGYTYEAETRNNNYEAYNSEGYNLRLYYYETSQEVSLDLDAPIQLSNITWPTVGLASLIPAPKLLQGKIVYDVEDMFGAYLRMSKDDLKEYMDQIYNAGFSYNYYSDDTGMRCSNEAGDTLYIYYSGFNVVELAINKAEEPEETIEVIENDE